MQRTNNEDFHSQLIENYKNKDTINHLAIKPAKQQIMELL